MKTLSLAVLSLLLSVAARAADPVLKPGDVIALIGGEEMVVEAENGSLEVLLQRALPGYRLKVRSLAWEGDTVFEQPRDLNYPTLEQQLDELGATVVLTQFGRMESLAGREKLAAFEEAYEKLIGRLGGEGKRRVIPLVPTLKGETGAAYAEAIRTLPGAVKKPSPESKGAIGAAAELVRALGLPEATATAPEAEGDSLRGVIAAKNRLWFHYTRPQNWAFLNGDRTEQPSSRDHRDPTKRWFPEEMKQWLPLVEAREKEIWDLAQKTAKP